MYTDCSASSGIFPVQIRAHPVGGFINSYSCGDGSFGFSAWQNQSKRTVPAVFYRTHGSASLPPCSNHSDSTGPLPCSILMSGHSPDGHASRRASTSVCVAAWLTASFILFPYRFKYSFSIFLILIRVYFPSLFRILILQNKAVFNAFLNTVCQLIRGGSTWTDQLLF